MYSRVQRKYITECPEGHLSKRIYTSIEEISIMHLINSIFLEQGLFFEKDLPGLKRWFISVEDFTVTLLAYL